MQPIAEIFEKNREHYLEQIAGLNFEDIKDKLGLTQTGDKYRLSFFGETYIVGKDGIRGEAENPPDYTAFIIIAKYLLLCPDMPGWNPGWCAFRDFKKISHFTNVNYFSSDTERGMAKAYAGKRDALVNVCEQCNGKPVNGEFAYDVVYEFQALPRISLLLLYNDGDEEFGAYGTVLFQGHAEDYLDPESLSVTSAYLVKRLQKQIKLKKEQ
jgi:hypothetical protein